MPKRPNVYTGSSLDRASERRADAAWIEAARVSAETAWLPVWRARNLMRGAAEGRPEAVLLSGEAAAALRASAVWLFLGLQDGRAVFTADVSEVEEPESVVPPRWGEFVDLRTVAGTLLGPEASLLAQARALTHWRGRHRFCGVCGAACVPTSAGHVLKCTGCATQHFPRTDPAVIMLVTDGERALLGHSPRFPDGMFSTLAGFVEPGESLEEAVAREVFEEAGVRLGRIHYHSSQPWPFPASLMLGFYAEALTAEIRIDADELAEARWFTRDEIRNHEAHGFSLPRVDSIARHLIEDWIAAE